MAHADVLLGELAAYAPDLEATANATVAYVRTNLGFHRLDAESFTAAPKISFDYAMMEKTDKARVLPVTFRWSDIGSWDADRQISDEDEQGNIVTGNVKLLDAQNCSESTDRTLAGLVGTQYLVVSVTSDAVLVTDRARSQDIKELVDRLKAKNCAQAHEHRLVRCLWGSYDVVGKGDRFNVKRLTVHFGAAFSIRLSIGLLCKELQKSRSTVK